MVHKPVGRVASVRSTMRVVLLTPFWRPVVGGVSHYVSELSQELRNASHEVHIVALEGHAENEATIIENSFVDLWVKLPRLLREWSPDVVHVHGHWGFLPSVLLAQSRNPQMRILYTFHTSAIPRGLRRTVFRRLLNRCDVVTAVSADLLAREAAWLRPKAAIALSRPGAREPKLGPETGRSFRHALGIGDGTCLIVAISPLHYQGKVAGLLDLIRGVKLLASTHPEVRLVIVGDGALRRSVEAVVKEEGLDDRVRLVGSLADSDSALSAADVVAHVSYRDEMPLAVLEAMAHGKPIVCTPVGGVPEAIRDGREGLFARGAAETAAAIERLIQDPVLRNHLGGAALQRASSEFTWGHVARRQLTLYGAKVHRRIHFSMDVEEDYRSSASDYRGVEDALPRILEMFHKHRVSASFFITGDVAARYPDLPGLLRREGHHVGLHGLSHKALPLAGRTVADQTRELLTALEPLRHGLSEPRSFRAPNFWFDAGTVRALQAASLEVDASVLPDRFVRRTLTSPRIDFRGAPLLTYRISEEDPVLVGRSKIVEVPVTSNPFAPGSPLGLGYLNNAGSDRALEAISSAPVQEVVFLLHPWEAIDYPDQERLPRWMKRGCTSELGAFEEFLSALTTGYDVVPFDSLLETIVEPNAVHGFAGGVKESPDSAGPEAISVPQLQVR